MHARLPRFSGKLRNYCDTGLCCTTTRYWITGVVTSIGHMLYAFGKVGKPGMVLKNKQPMAIQHVRLTDTTSCYMVSTLKGKDTISPSWTWPSTTVVHGAVAHCSCIFHSSCYHLLVQLMFLDESYREYDTTAGGCTNSEYQVLLYNILLCRTRASISAQVQGFSG